MPSLREQLARKRAHSTSLRFPLGEAGERAKAMLDVAQRALQIAQLTSKESEKAAEHRVRRAEATYAEVSVTVAFRGLTENERDALISAHPASPEQEERDKNKPEPERSSIDRSGFLPAALAVATLDSDMSEADWVAELASSRWTAGELNALFVAVVSATNAEPAPGIPKGSGTTR